jgi:hypothetical protein
MSLSNKNKIGISRYPNKRKVLTATADIRIQKRYY